MSWHSLVSPLTGLILLLAGLLRALEPGAAILPVDPVDFQAPAPPPQAPPIRGAPGPVAAGPRAATLAEAEQARRNGDFGGAAAVLRLLTGIPDTAVAVEAHVRLTVVLLEGGRGAEALDPIGELLNRELDGPTRRAALLLRARAQRAVGDCSGALGTLAEARQAGGELVAYIDLQAAECAAALGDRAAQAQAAARAADAAPSRLARIDALEHQVDAALERGDREAGLALSEQLLSHASTRSYRATTLTSIGLINLELGRRDAAALAFSTVIAELPDTSSASLALDKLAGMGGALALVGTDKIGLVQHFSGRHADAVASLSTARGHGLPPDRAAAAMYHEGLSLISLGRLDEAVRVLREGANSAGDGDAGSRGLLRAGRALEGDGRLTCASDVYREAAQRFPATAAGQEAHARLVVTLARRGAHPEAVATARELAERDADSRWKGLALLWAGKAFALAGDAPQALDAWRLAADVDADYFGGLRARAILDGDLRAEHTARALEAAQLEPSVADLAELAAWLARHGAPGDLDTQLGGDPNVALAGALYRIGLRPQASWELEEVAARRANEPGALFWLARYAAGQGEAQLGVRFAEQAKRASGEPLAALPRVIQRLIYPLPFADLILAAAGPRRVDPLLFAALIRKESMFNPAARSSANALGLTQVIPTTGQGIARSLGRPDFKNEDLFRPIVSVEFGLYYLSTQLQQYGGLIYPALAAYNAGGGNANRWIAEFGLDDVDLFAERIPFDETNRYVQVTYEYYQIYRRLYGG